MGHRHKFYLLPKSSGGLERIDIAVLTRRPHCRFDAIVMTTTERHCEFVADLERQHSRLRAAQAMQI
jgi:hypothetical protein